MKSRLPLPILALTLLACFGPDDKETKPPVVQNPPVITTQPRDTIVTAGASVAFTVRADSALSYQWVRLPSDTLAGKIQSSLSIPAADTSLDSTSYLCVVRNLNGTVVTRTALLRVTVPIDTAPRPPAPRNCKENPVVFTQYLIDPSLVKTVAQIGSIGGGNTEIIGRSYVFPKDGQTGLRLLLRAPADMKLLGSKHYRPGGTDTIPGYVPDWSLYFSAGCGVNLEFYHIKDVSARIKAASDTFVYPSSNWVTVQDTIRLSAGDTLGWYIPAAPGGLAAFDFIVKNDSVTNRFANQARYVARGSNILHTVCPYDLFESAKKTAYYALLGSVTGVPIPGTDCGTVERDVIGTPAGEWFFDSAFVAGPGVLNKEGDYGDPFPIIVMPDSTIDIGHTGPSGDVRVSRDNPTWKRPQDITTEWCYQLYSNPTTPDGWLWLKMLRADKMNAAFGATGTCPSTFPATGFKTYYR